MGNFVSVLVLTGSNIARVMYQFGNLRINPEPHCFSSGLSGRQLGSIAKPDIPFYQVMMLVLCTATDPPPNHPNPDCGTKIAWRGFERSDTCCTILSPERQHLMNLEGMPLFTLSPAMPLQTLPIKEKESPVVKRFRSNKRLVSSCAETNL